MTQYITYDKFEELSRVIHSAIEKVPMLQKSHTVDLYAVARQISAVCACDATQQKLDELTGAAYKVFDDIVRDASGASAEDVAYAYMDRVTNPMYVAKGITGHKIFNTGRDKYSVRPAFYTVCKQTPVEEFCATIFSDMPVIHPEVTGPNAHFYGMFLKQGKKLPFPRPGKACSSPYPNPIALQIMKQ